MSLLERTKFLLRKHRIYPKESLGQNFLVDSSIFHLLADYCSLNSKDVVLDIGAGLGFLTRFLAEVCSEVVAVESDKRLVKVLQEQLKDLSNVKMIWGDVLKVKLPHFNKIVSIPPYHISSPLLLWLFSKDFDCAVLIFQKEFAHRLFASVGSEDYGWLAVVAYYFVDVEIFDDVPKWMFYPQPEVDSVVVRLKPKKPKPFDLNNRDFFIRLTQSLFAHRNRKVRNAIFPFLKGFCGMKVDEAAKKIENFPFFNKRVRELAPEDFGALANALV
ncbi:MAG: 16S rRNA (adenine(1518)-N(6)/adenine(1519)-N(6))-dimethyltransferase RsmA [Candidatus Bathyarchaeota archaeon]|jgi:16S rRNA (adenine1518-N6/adenine1519-N6)-dimethyltransferase|nr:16S rRNA (adenine(1518)-N(6)/adenine(1519)-N(6))-dimethyltransferase RsmA [Candidatus Bathyarchaeota archaeon]